MAPGRACCLATHQRRGCAPLWASPSSSRTAPDAQRPASASLHRGALQLGGGLGSSGPACPGARRPETRLGVTLDPDYVNVIPEWQLWVGGAAGAFPFLVASYEFGKRILLQKQCEVCAGSGLVKSSNELRKCPACGGFLPWQSWDRFFQSNHNVGNGGPLLRPSAKYGTMQAAARAGELPYGPGNLTEENAGDAMSKEGGGGDQEDEDASTGAAAAGGGKGD